MTTFAISIFTGTCTSSDNDTICEETLAHNAEKNHLEKPPVDSVVDEDHAVEGPIPTQQGKQVYPLRIHNRVNISIIFYQCI